MELLQILFAVFISGLIGYVTNVLAIKALFRPLMPVKIPFLPLSFQGLIPKRRRELGESIGRMVQEDLLDERELLGNMIDSLDREGVHRLVQQKIRHAVYEKTRILPRLLRGLLAGAVEELFARESDSLFEELGAYMESSLHKKMNISKMVEDKVNRLDLLEIEEMIFRISSRELKHIEWLGLVMGCVIGLFQGVLTAYVF